METSVASCSADIGEAIRQGKKDGNPCFAGSCLLILNPQKLDLLRAEASVGLTAPRWARLSERSSIPG